MTAAINLVKVFNWDYDDMNHHFEGYAYAVDGGFTLTIKDLTDGSEYPMGKVYPTLKAVERDFIFEMPAPY